MTQGQMPDIAALWAGFQGQADTLAQECADIVRPFAPVYKGPDPDRTPGMFAASIEGEADTPAGGVVIRIKGDDPPGRFIIDGTAAHEIVAARTKTLRFYVSGGDLIFRRSVQHPGTQPNPFGEEAADALGAHIADAVAAAFGG